MAIYIISLTNDIRLLVQANQFVNHIKDLSRQF